MALGGAADGAELLQLAVQRKAVAALGLGRGGAPGEHLVHPAPDVRGQFLFTRPAGGVDRGEDAAAGRRDLLVGLAREARRELLLAGAGPGQVGVGIDEPRDQRAAPAVQSLDFMEVPEEAAPFFGITHENDLPVAADHLGSVNPAHPPLVRPTERRGPLGCRHFPKVVDQEVRSHRRGL